jgi:hypothetical protein
MTDGGTTTTTTATSARVGGKSLSLSTSFIRKPLLLLLLLLCSTTKGTTTTTKKTKGGPPVVDILFFCAMSYSSSFRLLTATRNPPHGNFRLDVRRRQRLALIQLFPPLTAVIVYITSGVLFGRRRRRRCLAALVTTVIQKVVFVSPITLLHARTSPCTIRLLRVERIPPFSFPYSHRGMKQQQHRQ